LQIETGDLDRRLGGANIGLGLCVRGAAFIIFVF
jgi:hypothetical protein